MRDLERFREAVRTHRRALGRSQIELAHALGLHPNVLSHKLHGSDCATLTQADVVGIVVTLARWGALTTRTEAHDLLDLMAAASALPATAWAAPPLSDLSLDEESVRVVRVPAAGRPGAAPAPSAGTPSGAESALAPLISLPLPAPLTPLIGRAAERAAVHAALTSARLVTLTGVGGTGKTRLALEVAREAAVSGRFTGGVAFVDLAPLGDPALLALALARALGLVETPADSPEAQLARALHFCNLLLVTDNMEHLLDEVPLLARLLAAAPALHILATSRVRLHLSGEHEIRVPPLPLPALAGAGVPADPVMSEAVQLFVSRARAAAPWFVPAEATLVTVGAICRALDGLPLAIELAAARTKLFPPEVLLPRLTARLTLLTDGPRDWPARQRTLRATLDWSYDLLPPDARALFACLGVFSGRFDAGAAAEVCVEGKRDIMNGATEDEDVAAAVLLERLAALADQSLLEVTPGSTPRFHLLETVREYALARLAETGQQEAMRDRHLHYYLSVAEEAEQALRGPEAAGWMIRLEAEHDNLRAALAWAREGGALIPGLRLAGALQRFWEVAGQLSEGRIWLEGLLAATEGWPADAGVAAARATALNGAGNLARGQGRYAKAQALIEESLALQRGLGNRVGVGYALFRLALVLRERGDYPGATALYEECRTLYQTLGDRAAVAYVLLGLGDIARDQGDAAEAERYCGASLRICRELGHHWASGFSLNNLALAAAMRGELAAAHALAEEALGLFRAQGIQGGVAETLIGIGQLECDQGAFEQARATLARGLARSWPAGPQWLVAAGMEEMARVALAQDQAALATRLCGAAAAWRGVMSAPLPPYRRARYERTVAAARVALGEDGFAAAWAAGSALRPEQAVAEALAAGG